ncbi:hypothetical protein, partial [Comamonas thiooxydans]|uniref:hypothetical protein n=1 Tax=Comamonas thiooxydans TaxID=363952 RepID=UPI001C0E94FA
PSSSQLPSFSPSLICIRRPVPCGAGRFKAMWSYASLGTQICFTPKISVFCSNEVKQVMTRIVPA